MLFSLTMAVLIHKWEFKNTEVEFLKVSEKIWSPGLPDIGARKSCDFLILTVSASTAVKPQHKQNKNNILPDHPAYPYSQISSLLILGWINSLVLLI